MKKQVNQLPSVKKELNPNFILVNQKLAIAYQKYHQPKQTVEQKKPVYSFLIIDNQTGQIICE